MEGKFYFKTDVGLRRPNNEDNAFAAVNQSGDVLLLVLDGMGGHQKGDVASKLAIEFIEKKFKEHTHFISNHAMKSWFNRTIKHANAYVNRIASSKIEYKDMGTTLVGIMIRGDYTVLANIGDSRAYMVKDNKLVQISQDQTYVQFLYKTGKIKKDEIATHPKRHVLMNALGTYPSVSTAISKFNEEYQYLLLCSDGLYNVVEEEEILRILISDKSINQKCDDLIDLANNKGGPDNIAVNIFEVKKVC